MKGKKLGYNYLTYNNLKQMKSKKNQKKQEEVRCPECGKPATFIPPQKVEKKILLVTFSCPNKHTFIKSFPLV